VFEIKLFITLFFHQPEVFESMETTASGIGVPAAVTNCHTKPVVVLETLNPLW